MVASFFKSAGILPATSRSRIRLPPSEPVRGSEATPCEAKRVVRRGKNRDQMIFLVLIRATLHRYFGNRV